MHRLNILVLASMNRLQINKLCLVSTPKFKCLANKNLKHDNRSYLHTVLDNTCETVTL